MGVTPPFPLLAADEGGLGAIRWRPSCRGFVVTVSAMGIVAERALSKLQAASVGAANERWCCKRLLLELQAIGIRAANDHRDATSERWSCKCLSPEARNCPVAGAANDDRLCCKRLPLELQATVVKAANDRRRAAVLQAPAAGAASGQRHSCKRRPHMLQANGSVTSVFSGDDRGSWRSGRRRRRSQLTVELHAKSGSCRESCVLSAGEARRLFLKLSDAEHAVDRDRVGRAHSA